ncbi:hypothetical protein JYQ62_24820 [Nostoc sp. UHCC 0702]|nr:hypothetical protein JYQ62_24820 [Nostoc sp. UHCC 0702]
MSDKIIYPSVELFLYDLKDGLGQDQAKIENNLKEFLQKIFWDFDENSFLQKYKQIKNNQHGDISAIELLETRIRKFNSPLDGYYYPVQVGDTYALQVNYSGKLDADGKYNDSEQSFDDQLFQNLKQEIENRIKNKTGTIGQTWLIWGKLAENKSDDQIEAVAKQCYTQIVSNYKWDRDLIGKGKLLGGTVFELWYLPEDAGVISKEFWQKFSKESHHVLIWLFAADISADEMRTRVQKIGQDFLRLLQYRHKIVWAYYQSLYQKNKLKTEFIKVQTSINAAQSLQTQLNQRKLNLTELQTRLTNTLVTQSDYTIELNYLDDQTRNIKTNLENYKYRLAEISRKHQGSDLHFLQEFSESEIYAQKYLRQAETDYANLNPGLNVLQNLSNTLQGIIQLEQTKSDRKLDNTIAIVGVGLAISGLTATVATEYLPKPKQYSAYDISVLISPAFLFSLAISAPFLIILIIRLFRR